MSLVWSKGNAVVVAVSKALSPMLLVLGCLLATGCGGGGSTKAGVATGCTLNSDCSGLLVCSFGLCHQECKATSDCPAGERCVQTDATGAAPDSGAGTTNVCQLQKEATCGLNSDCKPPLKCAIDLQCRNQCETDADCLMGQQCSREKLCAEPTELTDAGTFNDIPDSGTGGSGGGSGGSAGTGGGSGGTGGEAGVPGGGEAGAPETCVAGGACTPDAQPCHTGSFVCQGGQQVCSDTGSVKDGTSCGTGQVCAGGSCVACVQDMTCTPPANPCENGKMDCTAAPVCNSTGTKTAGSSCGTDKVCDSIAKCTDCVQDGPCTPTANDCHQGKQDCATGPNCVDQQTNATDGIACGTPGFNQFCSGGVCAQCYNGLPCAPANPCHNGGYNCSTSPPTCNDLNTNVTDGLICGTNQSCIAGVCHTNDRTLTVTSGAVPAASQDAPFTTVTVHLVDSSNAAVAGAAVTVTASDGAYAAGTTTDSSGNSKISGRVGRSASTYTYTVSAPGATPIQFTVAASAVAPKTMFTLVNTNFLDVVPTVPAAGTQSGLYQESHAVASAKDGTLYIADYCSVLELSPLGKLTRVAGNDNTCGFAGDGGDATLAKLYVVDALALDEPNQQLYIADQNNLRVRVVDLASGTISTYAGDGNGNQTPPYGDGGTADSAFVNPTGLSVAPNGDLYISDASLGRIRKVDYNTGVITSFMSASPCVASQISFDTCGGFGDSCNVQWDAQGQMFVAGYFCGGALSTTVPAIVRVNADTSLTLIAGNGGSTKSDGVVATTSNFGNTPSFVFDKAGDMYLSIRADQQIRRIDAVTDKITTVAGGPFVGSTPTHGSTGDYGAATAALLYDPVSLAIDGAGSLYIADSDNYAIRTVATQGDTVAPTATLSTVGGTGQSVTIDAPFSALTVKLVDQKSANISGAPVVWQRVGLGSGLGSVGASTLAQPTAANGNSSQTGRVGLAAQVYSFTASYSDIHGTAVTGSPQTFSVTAGAPTAGTIFPIVNYVHTSAETGVPGPGTFAHISYTYGAVGDSKGNLYLSEYCSVMMLSPIGEISVFAGTPGSCSFAGDGGPATNAKLYNPEGLAIDEANGVLYIADNGNSRIRVVSLADGTINTFAGGGSSSELAPYGDGGNATAAYLPGPESVSVDSTGVVYVPDNSHNRIRMIDPVTSTISTWIAGIAGVGTTCATSKVAIDYVDSSASNVVWVGTTAYISGYLCGTDVGASYALGVVKRASDGTLTRLIGTYNVTPVGENVPALGVGLANILGLAVNSKGDVAISTYSSHTIRLITASNGNIKTLMGNGAATGTGTAGYFVAGDPAQGDYEPSTSVEANYPYKIYYAPGDHLIVPDQNNFAFREIW